MYSLYSIEVSQGWGARHQEGDVEAPVQASRAVPCNDLLRCLVWGLGFGVWGLGFEDWGLGFGGWGLWFRSEG